MDSFSASETYSDYTYWHVEPVNNLLEAEMNEQIKEIEQRQKTTKSNSKSKTPTATTTTPTPTTTIVKPGGEKLITIAQATENTVKRA